MASSVFVNQWLLPPMLLLAVLFCFKLGKGESGIAETGIGYLPEPGSGTGGRGVGVGGGVGGGGYGDGDGVGDGDGDGGGGGGHDEPDEVVAKALLCFSEKHIYRSCDESFRLTESGQLHVPPEQTDEFCNGPCLRETHLVLNCVDDILTHFVFYNHATIKDVKETIKAGCSFGSLRGNFNVAEHIEGDESNSCKLSNPMILLGLSFLILVINMLF